MNDIVDMLRKTANQEFATYDVRDDSVRVGCGTLLDAAEEITRLRSDIVLMRSIVGFKEIKHD